MEFERREAPYLAPTAQVSTMMLQVLIALVPAAIAHVWYFKLFLTSFIYLFRFRHLRHFSSF